MDNKHCRFCGKELKITFADLGFSPLSNEYLSAEGLERGQMFYPLKVMTCGSCYLVQALKFRRPEEIFTDYKYFSSFSESWLEHCKKYVDMIVGRLGLGRDSMVYEIACNDGYLLQYFKPYGIPVCGIEPAANVAEKAKAKGIDVEAKFFGNVTAKEISEKHGKADLIIGNNVLAHVPDINGFVEGVNIALKDRGTATFEFPHLLKLIDRSQFDTIYHEHFSYLSLIAVTKIFEAHGLKIYDAEELSTHGGSLRIYAAHKDNREREESSAVRKVLEDEINSGLNGTAAYENFSLKVHKVKYDSCRILADLKQKGAKIAAFGAAAKGNTFLNYCGIGKEYIDFAADSGTAKQGMFLPGTGIPIVSPDVIREKKPDYIVFLAWNLKDEFMKLLDYTREWGCRFITFLPEVKIF